MQSAEYHYIKNYQGNEINDEHELFKMLINILNEDLNMSKYLVDMNSFVHSTNDSNGSFEINLYSEHDHEKHICLLNYKSEMGWELYLNDKLVYSL